MKIGISLSGGGARGFAHLGILTAYFEAGGEVSRYAGTSAGAIIGAFLAAGYEPGRIKEIILSSNLMWHFRPSINGKGLIKMEKVAEVFRKYLPSEGFEALDLPLTVAATDIQHGKTRYFEEGPLIQAVMASSSLPVIFAPIKIEDTFYVDGGLLDNMPVAPLENRCDTIIGLNCNPFEAETDLGNFREMMERSLLLAVNYNTHDRAKRCDVFLEPSGLSPYKVFALNKAEEIYNIGYRYMQEQLETNEKLKAIIGK